MSKKYTCLHKEYKYSCRKCSKHRYCIHKVLRCYCKICKINMTCTGCNEIFFTYFDEQKYCRNCLKIYGISPKKYRPKKYQKQISALDELRNTSQIYVKNIKGNILLSARIKENFESQMNLLQERLLDNLIDVIYEEFK